MNVARTYHFDTNNNKFRHHIWDIRSINCPIATIKRSKIELFVFVFQCHQFICEEV